MRSGSAWAECWRASGSQQHYEEEHTLMPNSCGAFLTALSLLFLLAFPISTSAQTVGKKKSQSKTGEVEARKGEVSEAALLEAQQRASAISLIISLADEARRYQDMALRPRVLARVADTLWDADNATARPLFYRAWEAAEKGDAEELTVKTKGNPPPVVMALRRVSGRDLRSEVLSLVARRDRALSEEFLAKLKDDIKQAAEDSKNNTKPSGGGDSWSTSEATAKRLQIARKLLDDNQPERALEFATPALGQVNASSIGFLSALRAKKPEVADQRFAFLLSRAELDPATDANTVSGLSSYTFTPGYYVTFSADGSSRWTQGDSVSTAHPDLPPFLLQRFFQVAASILLRPLLPPDRDFTSSGRTGKYMVIKRLLPLFEQYASETALALRAQLTALEGEPLKTTDYNSSLLVKGLQREEIAGDALEKLQDRIEHAKTSRARDLIYADAAIALANQYDVRAQDIADKIDDSDRRLQIRRYVDLSFVQHTIRKKEAAEVVRLAKAGELTHTQRAWAYIQAARLIVNSERQSALDYLQEAVDESRRADASDPDRARVLMAAVAQYVTADSVRAWELMDEAVKSANSAEEFTGEPAPLTFSVASKSGINFINIGGEELDPSRTVRLLAKDDFYRSIDLVRRFKNDAPRATATLAVARTVLERK
ncbi:MAG: hypothetical protein ABR577_15530 [Pyrinomonadaceae bacterium]